MKIKELAKILMALRELARLYDLGIQKNEKEQTAGSAVHDAGLLLFDSTCQVASTRHTKEQMPSHYIPSIIIITLSVVAKYISYPSCFMAIFSLPKP